MNKRMIRSFIISLALLLTAVPLHAQDNETCLSCHGDRSEDAPFVNQEELARSIHGRNLCVSCHADAKDLPHSEELAPVSCGSCHRIESEIYMSSDHGRAVAKGIEEAATCTSCHGKTHTLLPSRNPASPVYRGNIPATCGECHADREKMANFRFSEKEPFETYVQSVHGRAVREGRLNAAVCSDCHGSHDLLSASNTKSRVHRDNIPRTCSRCHENVREVYVRSIHGKTMAAGIKESPVCTSCHGEHTIRAVQDPASSVYAGSISKTCSECHESKRIVEKFGLPADRLKTYEGSYHGLAARGGDLHVANCASCHGWHDILPSYDTQSSINPKNLRFTCGKCHPGAQARRIEGPIHGGEKTARHFLLRWAEIFYLTLIPLLIGFMLLHNFSDYLRKALSAEVLSTGPPTTEELHTATMLRLTVNERLQHAVLTLTFIVLAYTGFSLEYPDAWFAAPFAMGGGEALRKSIHRWTALCLVCLGFYHVFYMLGTRRGKELLKHHYLPGLRDLKDLLIAMVYNLGLRKAKPDRPYPSYIEKIEYWALIWGSIVMLTTSSLLVFSDYTIRFFPLWVSDLATLIHFYEATLACLAIVVWHIYWVIFDPDIYPMNWTWLVGSVRRDPGTREVTEKEE